MFAGKIDPVALTGDDVILCATHRLARHLRLAHDRTNLARDLVRWRPLAALTVSQWLAAAAAEALLAGDIAADAAPRLVLSAAQERLLWEKVIADALGNSAAELFDLEGLAAAAQEANALLETWAVGVAAEAAGDETRRFLAWRAEFRRRCADAGWLESARAASWQVEQVAKGAGRLTGCGRVVFAGFDRYTPQERHLAGVLGARGAVLVELSMGEGEAATAVASAQADRRAECRAAAAWAASRLAAEPTARLAIVVPELAAVRDQLADALDAALQPDVFAVGAAEMPRRYNFSLGTPLSRQPIVAAALAWLRLAANPGSIAQGDVGELLRAPYGPADGDEADACARLEARLRERLGPEISLARLVRFVRREGLAPRLLARLEELQGQVAGGPARRWPSAWGLACRRQLAAVGWPGERGLSSHEFQARQAFSEVLDSLVQFDGVLGRLAAGEAVARLSRLCRERVFQPETAGDPPLQVMGPLEAAGGRFDALWVMAMNDDVWPPSPRPNPLLPAASQRRARSPASCAEVEAAFAAAIHARLLRSAPEAVFSWAKSEGERGLRPSPLLAGMAMTDALTPSAAEIPSGAVEAIADDSGPPLGENERIGGGADLLKTQALCPAWAFYRYRLGAGALAMPTEGLDARARGILLHRALELFWRHQHGLETLRALAPQDLAAALATAIETALGETNGRRDEPLPPRLAALERSRLLDLLHEWMALEAGRSQSFEVVAQERDERTVVAGLELKLRADRVDELPDGRRLIIDYKSRLPAAPGWDGERIAEPQLPLYAAFAPGGGSVAGIAFAQVRRDHMGFAGEAAEDGLLPKVRGRPDWPQRLIQWRQRIEALAREIQGGWAPVSFARETQLRHCEVKPLLRLPEVRALKAGAEGEEEE
ncbi:MAG TPA: PD-(D/E)XK nuclease family protein [Rhodocyclaceae bacterium]|nr:PD-(D/E)XK nuclease family protein [Rhodocyclaceae bacterium]